MIYFCLIYFCFRTISKHIRSPETVKKDSALKIQVHLSDLFMQGNLGNIQKVEHKRKNTAKESKYWDHIEVLVDM